MASKPMGNSVDVPVDDSRDAVFNQRHVEVNQQAKPPCRKAGDKSEAASCGLGQQFDGCDFTMTLSSTIR
jgi:hypothetical protein